MIPWFTFRPTSYRPVVQRSAISAHRPRTKIRHPLHNLQVQRPIPRIHTSSSRVKATRLTGIPPSSNPPRSPSSPPEAPVQPASFLQRPIRRNPPRTHQRHRQSFSPLITRCLQFDRHHKTAAPGHRLPIAVQSYHANGDEQQEDQSHTPAYCCLVIGWPPSTLASVYRQAA